MELDELLRQTDKQTSEMQRAYDSETGHGTNATQQAAWNNRLKTLLTDKNCY
jgi:FtsZ-binding cell division protein ZapB